MSTFNFDAYQKAVSSAQNKGSSVKVGWFKLSDDGDEALVRINLSSTNDLQFATIHQLGASTNWMKVGCTNEFGSFNNTCPFCQAVAAGNTAIGKASKRVYIPMLVSYKDRMTGQWSSAQPVIWDKPAGFSREIANIIRDYGDLRNTLFKITRNGAKNDMKTTYSLMPAPPVFKPEMITPDFTAFDNFRLDKHSFWVKTDADMNTYIQTGSFPEYVKQNEQTPSNTQVAAAYAAQTASQPAAPAYNAPMYNTATQPNVNPVVTPAAQQNVPNANVAPWETQAPQSAQPVDTANKFSEFSF